MTDAERALFQGLYGIAGTPSDRTAELAEALVRAGVKVVQLRDKHADGRLLVASARRLRAITQEAGALFVVNDRVDVALMAGADGVHLGQDDLPIADARRVARAVRGDDRFLVGVSTHDLAQVRQAVDEGADYLGFGPILATGSKADALSPRGFELLAAAVQAAGRVPVVAIGGLGLAHVPSLRSAGVAMAAVIGDLVAAADPEARARAIHRAFEGDGAGLHGA